MLLRGVSALIELSFTPRTELLERDDGEERFMIRRGWSIGNERDSGRAVNGTYPVCYRTWQAEGSI